MPRNKGNPKEPRRCRFYSRTKDNYNARPTAGVCDRDHLPEDGNSIVNKSSSQQASTRLQKHYHLLPHDMNRSHWQYPTVEGREAHSCVTNAQLCIQLKGPRPRWLWAMLVQRHRSPSLFKTPLMQMDQICRRWRCSHLAILRDAGIYGTVIV